MRFVATIYLNFAPKKIFFLISHQIFFNENSNLAPNFFLINWNLAPKFFFQNSNLAPKKKFRKIFNGFCFCVPGDPLQPLSEPDVGCRSAGVPVCRLWAEHPSVVRQSAGGKLSRSNDAEAQRPSDQQTDGQNTAESERPGQTDRGGQFQWGLFCGRWVWIWIWKISVKKKYLKNFR